MNRMSFGSPNQFAGVMWRCSFAPRLRVLCVLLAGIAASFDELGAAGRQTETAQVPPLPMRAGEDCYIIDATPLLASREYASKSYTRQELSHTPLVLKESLNFDDGSRLVIEQRGCVDRYARFTFMFAKTAAKQPRQVNLSRAAKWLRDLQFESKTLFSRNEVDDVAKAIEDAASSDSVVCFLRVGHECIRDVSVRYAYPTVEAFLVDRP